MSIYTNYNKNEPYNVGWMDTSDHSKTGYVAKAVVVDSYGRKNPIIRYSTPSHNSEGYVAKVERVVEHVIPVPVIGFVRTDYRYSSEPAQEELIREYDKRHSQLGPTYDYSETAVKSFLTKIQDEVSQLPNKGNGFNSNWHARARPNPTVQDGIETVKNGDDKDFIKGSNNNKVNIVPIGDKLEKGYSPMIISNKDMRERPINEVPIVHNRPLSKPTNPINTAQAQAQGPNAAATLSPQPVNWRNGGYDFAAQGPKMDSVEDDSGKQQKQNMYGRDDNGTNYRQPVVPINNKDYSEKDERNLFGYNWFGNPNNVAIINSDDLIQKYKGAKVPF